VGFSPKLVVSEKTAPTPSTPSHLSSSRVQFSRAQLLDHCPKKFQTNSFATLSGLTNSNRLRKSSNAPNSGRSTQAHTGEKPLEEKSSVSANIDSNNINASVSNNLVNCVSDSAHKSAFINHDNSNKPCTTSTKPPDVSPLTDQVITNISLDKRASAKVPKRGKKRKGEHKDKSLPDYEASKRNLIKFGAHKKIFLSSLDEGLRAYVNLAVSSCAMSFPPRPSSDPSYCGKKRPPSAFSRRHQKRRRREYEVAPFAGGSHSSEVCSCSHRLTELTKNHNIDRGKNSGGGGRLLLWNHPKPPPKVQMTSSSQGTSSRKSVHIVLVVAPTCRQGSS